MKLILILAGMLTSKIVAFGAQKNLFQNEQGEAVTVNGDRYRAMLNEFLFTKIEEEDIDNIWFQRDGATWRSHYQPQSWRRLATSELRFDNGCSRINLFSLNKRRLMTEKMVCGYLAFPESLFGADFGPEA